MATPWTDEQLAAIHAAGGRVLVSAAAGSGKTAVLVERAFSRITAEQNGISADRLLLVTFSNAAAGEMRARITARLDEELERRPQDAGLLKQRALLGKAKICTMSSFCIDILRNYFTLAELPPDFRIADESELEIIRQDAMEELLESYYREGDPAFLELSDMLSKKNDRLLEEWVFRLYRFVRSHPFPARWLGAQANSYTAEHTDRWIKPMLIEAKEDTAFAIQLLQTALREMEGSEKLYEAYQPAFSADLAQAEHLLSVADDWESLQTALSALSFSKLGPCSRSAAPELQERVKGIRKEARGLLENLRDKKINCTAAELHEDLAALSPLVAVYCRMTADFLALMGRKKLERSLIDFADAEEKVLELLVTPTENGYQKTPLCATLAAEFDEICIDEFQDTNEVQDLIFTALSKEEKNLFLVGDVKQSIYAFRKAMPELFVQKREASVPYDGVHFPAKIFLSRNFRSRKEVTGLVNFLFSHLMTPRLGDNRYDDSEALIPQADYPAYDTAAELHYVIAPPDDDRFSAEARYAAHRIRRLVDSGYAVSDGQGGMRPCGYGDFCVLLRSVKQKAEVYAGAFRAAGIPVSFHAESDYFASREITLLLALLQVLINPLLDIPMTAVLYSPVFGFTSDEIAALRIRERSGSLYHALQTAAEEGDAHAVRVLELLGELRRQSVLLPLEDLIRLLYDKTGLLSYLQALPDGARRAGRLQYFLNYAARYAQTGGQDLGGFLRFLDRCKERETEGSSGSGEANEDAVQILSIHRSKGLEFPIVLLADCSRGFNTEDLKSDLLLHRSLGIGLSRKMPETLRKFSTLPREVIKASLRRQSMSEELRILYVALTRAREKLILLISDTGREGILKKAALRVSLGMDGHYAENAASFADWIMLSALRHPDAQVLRERAGVLVDLLPAESRLTVFCESANLRPETEQAAERLPEAVPDPEVQQLLEHRLSFRYPYQAETGLPLKLSVSEIAKPASAVDFSLRPAFLQQYGVTGAERGNALHTFMQFADFKAAAADPRREVDRMVSAAYLTEREASLIPIERVTAFLEGPLGKRLLCAQRVEREFKFLSSIPASFLDPTLTGEAAAAPVLIQGIADCLLFEPDGIVIVDYKTDRVNRPEELVERYQTQLQLYRYAMEDCFSLPVKETVIYSLGLSQEVPVPTEGR